MDGAVYRGLARILRERSITAYARIHTVRIRSYMYVTYTNLSPCSPAESAVGPNAGPGEDSLTSDECVQREPSTHIAGEERVVVAAGDIVLELVQSMESASGG